MECPTCEKTFSTKSNLNKHINKEIKCLPKPIEFKCERCQKIFKLKHHLQSHMKKKNICKIKVSDAIIIATIIAKEQTKQEELKLKQKKEETKQEELKTKRVNKEIKLYNRNITKDISLLINNLNNNITNNNITNNTFTVNVIDIKADITKEDAMKVIEFENPKDASKHIIKNIYVDHKDNRNIMCPDPNEDLILMKNNNRWEIESMLKQNKFLTSIANKIYIRKINEFMKEISKLYDLNNDLRYINNTSDDNISDKEFKEIIYENYEKYIEEQCI